MRDHDAGPGDAPHNDHFGRWLSRQRKARDLTQEDLAERLGCSMWTIQKFEVGSRRPSKQIAEMLADYFNVPAAEREAFLHFARGNADVWESLATSPTLQAATGTIQNRQAQTEARIRNRHNLPMQLTSFVGRAIELPRIRDLMLTSEVRLLTLTGPPGTGKTRLALQVAELLLRDFEDGVFFVSLAPITDPNLVISEIAKTMDIGERPGRTLHDGLEAYLRNKELLLVLDNFEQVVEAASLVGQLLVATPEVKVLATSRVPLHIRGEKEYLVPPLHLPDLEHLPPAQGLSHYEAVRLFVERATDVSADFDLTDDNASAVAAICARLDGLPLAIELAAARVKVFTPKVMLSKLGSRLAFLTGGPRDLPARQRTLRGAIEWSYDLLDQEEKKLFGRLGVFQDGRSLEAIEGVCNPEGVPGMGLLDRVASLVDKGLLRREEGIGGSPRLVMLETIHEFAREKLVESGEYVLLQREHALYFTRFAEEAERHLTATSQVEWLHKLEQEHENLRAALKWARTEDDPDTAEIGLRLAGALGRFWSIRGYRTEGREALEEALSRDSRTGKLKEVRARALCELGGLIREQGDLAAAQPYLEESLAIYREVGDDQGTARLLGIIGNLFYRQGEVSLARSLFEEALAISTKLGDKASIAQSLSDLAWLSYGEKNSAAARSMAEESLAIFRELGSKRGISWTLLRLGIMTSLQGAQVEARTLIGEALAIDRELGDKAAAAHKLGLIGELAVLEGDYASGRALYEEGLATFRELGDTIFSAWLSCNLGHAAVLEGDYSAAQLRYEESLRLARKSGDKEGIVQCLHGLGAVATGTGQGEKGARLLGASDALRERIIEVIQQDDLMVFKHGVALARAQLSDEQFERAWQEGRAMALDDAVASALEY